MGTKKNYFIILLSYFDMIVETKMQTVILYVHTLTQKLESLEKRNKEEDRNSKQSRSHSDMLDEKVPSFFYSICLHFSLSRLTLLALLIHWKWCIPFFTIFMNQLADIGWGLRRRVMWKCKSNRLWNIYLKPPSYLKNILWSNTDLVYDNI